MSEKILKIKPKVWPKEYTFEEFKGLNPNINETLDEYGKILLKLNKHSEGLNFIRKGTGLGKYNVFHTL